MPEKLVTTSTPVVAQSASNTPRRNCALSSPPSFGKITANPRLAELAHKGLPADVVVEFREKLGTVLREAGHGDADAISMQVERQIREEWGRFTMYVPTGTRYRTEWMRQQVRARWNGRNTVELAKELKISDRNLRILAADMRQRRRP